MKIDSDQTLIVFLGSFNPRLFHPSWLEINKVLTQTEANGVLGTGDERAPLDQSSTLIVTQEVSQIVASGLQITVQPNRLQIAALTPDRHSRSFEIAVALKSLLPHTPVTAIGLNRNFILDAESAAAWNKIGHTVVPKEGFWSANGEQPGTAVATVRYPKCAVSNAHLNLSIGPVLERSEPLVRVNCNYHFGSPHQRSTHGSESPATTLSAQREGTRLDDFGVELSTPIWDAVCQDALDIAERVSALAKG